MFSNIETGDVIMLSFFPHEEDKTQGEARCVIVLEKYDDKCSIVPLTCQAKQSVRYNKFIEVEKNSDEGQEMGLICDSLIIVDREIELPKVVLNKILSTQGTCPDDLLDEIHSKLKE